MKYTSNGPKCLCVLLGVSLLFHEHVLGRTFIFAHGEPSGFFVFGRCLMRRIVNPRGYPMLLLDSSSTLQYYLSSGIPNVRRGSICLYRGDILNHQLPHSCTGSTSLRPDFRSAENINIYHADMGISVPVSAFFVPRTHIPVDNFSAN